MYMSNNYLLNSSSRDLHIKHMSTCKVLIILTVELFEITFEVNI